METVNEKPPLRRVMIYCDSAEKALHMFAIAKIFNNIEVDIHVKRQVPILVSRTLTVIGNQITLVQSDG